MLKRKIIFDLENEEPIMRKAPFLKTKGVITFQPKRNGLKMKKACCVIEVDEEIVNYYRYMTNQYYKTDLIKPSWAAHVSIVQGSVSMDDPKYLELVDKYEGLEVELEYSIYPRYSGDTEIVPSQDAGSFWFLNAKSKEFIEIRKELGLVTNYNPHLTIAKKGTW